MTGRWSTRFACVLAAALIALVGSAARAIAADPPDTIVLPAGLACAEFDLQIDIWANPNQVYKEFFDKNGNVVRTLQAGKGNTLVFTNVATGQTLGLKANGSVNHSTINPDGSTTVALTGHNVLIMFPTDVPAGPSTTLYVGEVVFTIDLSGVYTLQSVSGTATDICAALQ